jgi:hypothetical protein
MAELMVRTRNAFAALLVLALAGVMATGCGSGEDTTSTPKPPAISAAAAGHLATLSDRIATDLDAGSTCDAAYAADELKGAVEDADLSTGLRPGVEQVASRLVDEVNCPPPPAPEPEKDKKKEEHGHHEKGSGGLPIPIPIPPGHGGHLPPGHAKPGGEGE